MFNSRSTQFNTLYLLVGVNIAIFLCVLLFRGPNLTVGDTIQVFGAFNTYFVNQGSLWLFITAAFLHFDFLHILFNVFALIQLGIVTRLFYGDKVTFLVYIITAITSHIATYLAVLMGLLSSITISLGASGAIFGLLGLLVGGTMKKRRFGSELPLSTQQFTPIILNAIIISFLPNINWVAHLGGFVGGMILAQFIPTAANTDKNGKNVVQWLWVGSILTFMASYVGLVLHLFLGN